ACIPERCEDAGRGRHSITPMMAITIRETATSSMLLHALGESARMPNAAPGFSVCTILKNPPITGVTSWDVTPVIGGFFNIVHTENPGAAFGILADSPSAWSSMLLVTVSLVVMSVIGVMLWRPRPTEMQGPGLVSVGLALVFGGALGNVWDRLFRGTVTDFLQMFFGSYEFPS